VVKVETTISGVEGLENFVVNVEITTWEADCHENVVNVESKT
jgi:hypothetical protein